VNVSAECAGIGTELSLAALCGRLAAILVHAPFIESKKKI
jgi:hypothetical protein